MKNIFNGFVLCSSITLLVACSGSRNISYIDNIKQDNKNYAYKLIEFAPAKELERSKNDSVFNYALFNSEIKISHYIRPDGNDFKEFKQNIENLKKRKSIDHFEGVEVDSIEYFRMNKYNGQTCYSFAIESYLKSNEVNPSPYFNSETLIGGEGYVNILSKLGDILFLSVKEFKRNLKNMSNEMLLGLRCKKMTTHGIFFKKGTYYSKNGYSQPALFSSLNQILKSYKYTDSIIVCIPNKEKLNRYIQ